jgi:ribosomal protein L11 methyltransferase
LKRYPALDIRTSDSDLLLARADDFAPCAVEERDEGVRVFFSTAAGRDAAQRALAAEFDLAAVDVSDEDWARRSQENLQPVAVGNITVFPAPPSSQSPLTTRPPTPSDSANPQSRIRNPLTIVIQPSMGFGTGHHATTRLCLAALQAVDLDGRDVLDVGTGSGVLAIAAARLGAAGAVGIDYDADAIQSAQENLALNGNLPNVRFEVIDLAAAALPSVDIVAANLTAALLVRSAATLLDAVRGGGTVILSGILADERDAVVAAFAPAQIVWERDEDGWVALAVKKS